MSIGLQIKLARVRKGMKAKDLAVQVDIAKKYLSQIENERAPGLSVDVLRRICWALGTEPNVIMEWHEETAAS